MPPFIRPIALEYPPTLGSHGLPQWVRGDDTDKFLPERPDVKIVSILRYDAFQGAIVGGRRGVFSCGFPRLG